MTEKPRWADGMQASAHHVFNPRAIGIILAHNEASVISDTVRTAREGQKVSDSIYVVADHCTDGTAETAVGAGAIVLERKDGDLTGKGAALKWFIEKVGGSLSQYDIVVILDADSYVLVEFWENIKVDYPGKGVMQCQVQPIGYQGEPLSTLIALSEIHEQKTLDALRVRFGWPVRLRGTGMVMTPTILEQASGDIDTEVEDIALSLIFTARRVPIYRNARICIYDPKPRESLPASQQRARWFRGQWAAFWHYRREVIRLLARGPAGWSLLDALFMRPLWLLDSVMLTVGLFLIPFCWVLAAFILARVIFDLVCLFWTVLKSDERREFLRAILHALGFIKMWLRSLLLAFQRSPWRRARR
jgi:cellulose synthase/poly-beta-1,6-N-acetylglucosamine synthase-like glycosyltransferase